MHFEAARNPCETRTQARVRALPLQLSTQLMHTVHMDAFHRSDRADSLKVYVPGDTLQHVLGTAPQDGVASSTQQAALRAQSAPALGHHGESNRVTSSSMWERVQAQRQAREQRSHAKQEAFQRATQRRKEASEQARDAAFQVDYQAVLDGLACSSNSNSQQSSHIMNETQQLLEHQQTVKGKKQVELHKEWNAQVFDKIQARLQTAVGRRTDKAILTRLRSQMDEYLHNTNTKLGVFRDVIIEQDYDPLKPHQDTIRVFTGDIKDPVKRDVLKPQHERALMGLSASADALPVGKNTLDTKHWGQLAITATPYGHNVDSSGDTNLPQPSDRALAARASHIFLDHYNYPMRDNQIAAQEMGRQGKRSVIGPEVRRGRRDLNDVIQQTCNQRPDFTGGDAWLEARGKGSAAGPEQLRGRADLSEIIQQSSNPYKDGRSLGDQWLETKGKAHPPGPEQRRGRADLTEIIQQSSDPYKDGRSLGDQWLETKGKAPLHGPSESVREFLFRDNCPPDPAKVKDPRRYVSVLVNNHTLHPAV